MEGTFLYEVDYDEGDEEMNEEQEEDEEIVVDEDEEDDTGDTQQAEESEKIPAWALNLDVGSKRLPVKGLINNDSSEGAALFDNAVVAKILGMYKYYYNQRVMMTPEDYQNRMTTGNVGRLDLDGICPYTGENDDGTLKRPSEEELDAMFEEKAKEEEWMQGEKMYGGRPRNTWCLWSPLSRFTRRWWRASYWQALSLINCNSSSPWTKREDQLTRRTRWGQRSAISWVGCWSLLFPTQRSTPTSDRATMDLRTASRSPPSQCTWRTGRGID